MIHSIAKAIATTLLIIVALFALGYGWVVRRGIENAEQIGQQLHSMHFQGLIDKIWCGPPGCKPEKAPTKNER